MAPAGAIKVLVFVHVGQCSTAVGAFLIERDELVFGGAGDNHLEFTGRVDDLDGRTGAAEAGVWSRRMVTSPGWM